MMMIIDESGGNDGDNGHGGDNDNDNNLEI